ncbi:MAG: PhzF family phenazine biosynthesis protein [Acidobacteria bacterium]|nr:PhzF family phenazine biosynthesis protein [Acidobacteriota bacterium]
MCSVAQRRFEFIQLDVFTRTRLEGNPLAVFTDARDLSDSEMQALAREMNLSETTFIFPRDRATEDREGVKVRIFTVEEELPFAGHPTLGTALCLRGLRGERGEAAEQIDLDLKVGRIPVRFSAGADGAVFGEMRQRDPEFGEILDRGRVAEVIGVPEEDLAPQWPIQAVSTGFAFAIVPFRRLESLSSVKFNFSEAAEFLSRTSARMFYFVCPPENSREARARMIFYNGEDPATGSAAGCAAAWMVHHNVIGSEEQILIRQGVEIRRPSHIFVRATRQNEGVTNVRVGGYAVEVARGTVSI